MNPLAVAAGQCVYKRNRRAVEGRGCTFDLPYRVYLTGCEGQKKLVTQEMKAEGHNEDRKVVTVS